MNFDADWTKPWQKGLPRAPCATCERTEPDGSPRLFVAVTLTDGRCRACAERDGVREARPPVPQPEQTRLSF